MVVERMLEGSRTVHHKVPENLSAERDSEWRNPEGGKLTLLLSSSRFFALRRRLFDITIASARIQEDNPRSEVAAAAEMREVRIE